MTEIVGPAAVKATARSLGVKSRLNAYFAIGLGAEAVNPLELARAYAAFPTGSASTSRSSATSPERSSGSSSPTESGRRTSSTRVRSAEDDGANGELLLQQSSDQEQGDALRSPTAGSRQDGTTENYGDGGSSVHAATRGGRLGRPYPDTLKPMLTEYQGEPVAGGSFPP